jgi:hypothetical protein
MGNSTPIQFTFCRLRAIFLVLFLDEGKPIWRYLGNIAEQYTIFIPVLCMKNSLSLGCKFRGNGSNLYFFIQYGKLVVNTALSNLYRLK